MDDYLIHYGVMGMKWGVRKDGAPQGTQGWAYNTKQKAKAAKEVYSKKQAVKRQRIQDSKNRSLLSDKDLDTKVERLSKEKKLKELTNEAVHPGRVAVKKILTGKVAKAAGAALLLSSPIIAKNIYNKVKFIGPVQRKAIIDIIIDTAQLLNVEGILNKTGKLLLKK